MTIQLDRRDSSPTCAKLTTGFAKRLEPLPPPTAEAKKRSDGLMSLNIQAESNLVIS